MDTEKPLCDWEMSRLAESISINEFGQIALQFLKIEKVQLDSLQENAGRNCVAYMRNTLIRWKDSVEEKEGRKLLYKALTEAAQRGLVGRTSFRFLLSPDKESAEFKLKRGSTWSCMKNNNQLTKNLKVILMLIFSLITGMLLLFNYPRAEDLRFNNLTSTFVRFKDMSRSTDEKGASLIIGSVNNSKILTMCIFLCIMVFTCFCCFVLRCAFYKAVLDLRNRTFFDFFLNFYLMLTCSVQAIYYFMVFTKLWHFTVPDEAVVGRLFLGMQPNNYKIHNVQFSWDRLQWNFHCCGVHSYKDWPKFLKNSLPDSCCKIYTPGCARRLFNQKMAKSGVEPKGINLQGCASPFASHINDQVRYQYVSFAVCLLAVAGPNLLAVLYYIGQLVSVGYKLFCRNLNNKPTSERVGNFFGEDNNFIMLACEGQKVPLVKFADCRRFCEIHSSEKCEHVNTGEDGYNVDPGSRSPEFAQVLYRRSMSPP